MANRGKRMTVVVPIVVVAGFALALFSPSPTPEWAVRKDILLSFHPVLAFESRVTEGTIKDDPRYGHLYLASGLEASFVYVKKSGYGWYVATRGTGP
ncbi:hypothetical protein [Paenibacillus sp. GCM10023250]|uniref:hypothetical protein n=1 Tax=Paenibacillus sp. GCM10023250 TaxID=3252648 RepID=UPI00361FF1AB